MSILHTTPSTLHPLRDAWIAIGVAPLALVLAVGVGFALDGSAGSWVGGAILSVLALAAPTYAMVEAHAADHEHVHGSVAALAAAVVAWLLVVAVLVLAVVSPVAALVGVTVSACVVLLAWGPPDST